MEVLRKFTAILFAALIANPLCCCVVHGADDRVDSPQKSCCSSEGADHQGHPAEAPCTGCHSKNPWLADAQTALASFLSPPLPALLPAADGMPRSREIPVRVVAKTDFPPGVRPPGLLLVLHQQFRI